MVIGSGPYDNEGEYYYTIEDIIEEIDISTEEASLQKGSIRVWVGENVISFDYQYSIEEETFIIINLHCTMDSFDRSDKDLDELKEALEEKLNIARPAIVDKIITHIKPISWITKLKLSPMRASKYSRLRKELQ